MNQPLRGILLIILGFILASCGGSGSGGGNGPAQPGGGNTLTPGVTLGANRGQALLGPIVGATVNVYEAENFNGIPLCSLNTSSLNAAEGPGVMDLSSCATMPGKLYFLVVRGGDDVDADDDGFLDSAPTPKIGALRALVSGDDIARGNFRINILTEIAYQSVTDTFLTGGNSLALKEQLDNVANQLLDADINSDDIINNTDLIAFSPLLDANAVSGDNKELMDKILTAIHSGNRGELTNLSRQLLLASLGEFNFSGFTGGQNFHLAGFLVDDGLLYAAGYEVDSIDDDLRILILDVRDFSNIGLIGDVSVAAKPSTGAVEMEKIGNFIYISSRGKGMAVADVTNTATPAAALAISNEDIYGIEAGGNNNLYVSFLDLHDLSVPEELSYIQIYDITNPSTPAWTGKVENLIAFNMVYSDGRLYTAGSGFKIFDAGSPSSLPLLGDHPSFGSTGFAVKNDHVYVNVNEFGVNGIRVFDAADPSNLDELETLSGSGLISDLQIHDNLIIASESLAHGNAVTTFEITETGSLHLLDSRSAPLNFKLEAEGGRVYLSGPSGFSAYPLAALKNRARHLDFIPTPRTASHVEVVGNTAYVADGNHLISVDVSTPGSGLAILSEVPAGNTIWDMKIAGNYAYLASEGLWRIDVSDRQNLVFEGSNMELNPITGPGGVDLGTRVTETVAVAGDYVYTQTGSPPDSWLGKFSIMGPGDPALIKKSSDDVFTVYKDLAIKGNFLYGVNGELLEVFNVDTLAFVSQIRLLARTVEVAGDYAYTSSSTSGISILNVANSSSPVLFGGRLSLGIGNAVSVVGNTAYVANEFGMIEVYDVSEKTRPDLLFIYKVNGVVKDVYATEDYVYAVNGFGLIIEPAIKLHPASIE